MAELCSHIKLEVFFLCFFSFLFCQDTATVCQNPKNLGGGEECHNCQGLITMQRTPPYKQMCHKTPLGRAARDQPMVVNKR